MTIDEAIENLKYDNEIDMYIRDIAPQLAEWLEELKKLREGRKEIPIATITFSKKDLQKMVDEKVKAIEIDIQAIKNETLNNLVEELEKVPTEYSHEEYNKAIRDVIKFVERNKRQVKNNE